MAVFLRGWRSFPMLPGQLAVVSFLIGISKQEFDIVVVGSIVSRDAFGVRFKPAIT